MTGQERYEYRPDDGGRSPYGTDEPGGHRRRGPAQPDSPDSAGGGGYDPLGIRRSPADLAGVADPPRGGDPYAGYERDGYADQPRGGRGYQADPYDAPGGGYDRDPYARRRDERPAQEERPAERGRDPYARDWPDEADRGGYPPSRDARAPGGYPEPERGDPYGRGAPEDRGGYPPPARDPREARDDRGGYGEPDRGGYGEPERGDPYGRGGPEDRGGYPPPARDPREARDDRGAGGYGEPDRSGYPPARDGRGGYPEDLDRESETQRRAPRRDDGYGYAPDPLGLEPGAAPERGLPGRGGEARHTTDPRYVRQGGDPRLGDPELSDPRHDGGRGARREPLDDPRGAGGWDREPGSAGATVWEAIVEAEREYYDSGDDHRVPFPTFYPRRVFALAGPKMLIGRRSESRGIHPDIDLSGAPEDPGISRSHAMFEQLPDGGYAVRDPGSTNGTRLNDEPDPIEPGQPVPLRDGDRVYLGAWTRITLRAR
ncbi:FHA domain-containing protein [Frankia sp. AgB32]|uniref:FHA domain-containing protein n=1 Tax=Frankia sp. AgB32 TaxID=631119 RepID=UPI0020105868|nr:FHA domain-containing protein [Frankia sp. AgB32]MCK9898025.1 FHA domain-containing protein [Frankia sp. AgB32]